MAGGQAGASVFQRAAMHEIDLDTGALKPEERLDYKKWDVLASHTADDDEQDEVNSAAYSWAEMPHGELRVVIPTPGKTRAKQVRVVIKRNWLTVFAPPPKGGTFPENAPPTKPILDFQLYGAVDTEESDWELVDDGALRNITSVSDRCGYKENHF